MYRSNAEWVSLYSGIVLKNGFMDNEDINSDLIRRYEDMLRCGERRYFDAEDIEDIAY